VTGFLTRIDHGLQIDCANDRLKAALGIEAVNRQEKMFPLLENRVINGTIRFSMPYSDCGNCVGQ